MEITQPRNVGSLCRHHTTSCSDSPRGHALSSQSRHPRPPKQALHREGPTDHPFSPRRLCLGQPRPTCPLLEAQDIDSRPITDKALPTPVQVENLNRWLQGYGKEWHALIKGFTFGFDIGFEGIARNVVCNNLKSAIEFPKLVQEKVSKELRLGRIAGPFGTPTFETFVTHSLGVVPKKESGAYRMIQHLSHPPGVSINDGIPFEKASVQYQTINHAIDHVKNIGRGSYMAKRLSHHNITLWEYTGRDYFTMIVALPWAFARLAVFLNSWVQPFTE